MRVRQTERTARPAVWLLAAVLLFIVGQPAWAEEWRPGTFFERGLRLIEQSRLEDAAEEFLARADDGASPLDPRDGAFALVLATITFERLDSPRAYETWAEATKRYLTLGLPWRQEASALRLAIEEARSKIRAISANGDSLRLDRSTAFLLDLEEELGFSRFEGPSLHLGGGPKDLERPVVVSRAYVPRLGIRAQKAPPAESQSRHGELEEGESTQAGPSPTEGPSRTGSSRVLPVEITESAETPASEPVRPRPAGPPVPMPRTVAARLTIPSVEQPDLPTPPLRFNPAQSREEGIVELDPQLSPDEANPGPVSSEPPAEANSPAPSQVSAPEPAPTEPIAEPDPPPSLEDSEPPLALAELPEPSPPRALADSEPQPTPVEPVTEASPHLAPDPSSPAQAPATPSGEVDQAPRREHGTRLESDPPDDAKSHTLLSRSPQAGPQPLTEQEREVARIAWQFFRANKKERTGLVNSVHRYSYLTMWDLGSQIAAMVCAEQLGLMGRPLFLAWLDLLLLTLEQISLYGGELPNREYSTASAAMTDIRNQPSSEGSGWSATDIGRLLIWLKITATWYPERQSRVEALVDGWTFDRLVARQEMNGTLVRDGGESYYQEGRLGYEHYAAAGMALWGHDLSRAFDFEHSKAAELEGQPIRVDTRDHPILTSDPFVLMTLELGGLSEQLRTWVDTFFRALEIRSEQTGVLTAIGEDSIHVKPWFVYRNFIYEETPWMTTDSRGRPSPMVPVFSTKAAFGWSAIFPDHPFAQRLFESAVELAHPRVGYQAGRYEDGSINRSRNVNTNAIILETLLYRQRGHRPFLILEVDHEGASEGRGRR
ncbi:MAG: DUF3131 domain-containing protein [Acidobacteriota bacterium]